MRKMKMAENSRYLKKIEFATEKRSKRKKSTSKTSNPISKRLLPKKTRASHFSNLSKSDILSKSQVPKSSKKFVIKKRSKISRIRAKTPSKKVERGKKKPRGHSVSRAKSKRGVSVKSKVSVVKKKKIKNLRDKSVRKREKTLHLVDKVK